MKIAAVVLNFRRAGDTIACVESIRGDAPDVDVIVVDNASGDGSAQRIASALPGIELIESKTNLGYAGGNNLGIRAALAGGADAILVLNNDLTIEPGCVAALGGALEANPRWGMAAPLSLLAGDGEIVDFFTGEVLLDHAALRAPGRDEPRGVRFTEPSETGYVTGSAMLIRREVIERAGLLDERYFLVWEDVEYSLRVRKAGFALGATPDAIVRHARSASFGDEASPLQRYFFVRNPYLLIRTHLPPPRRWLAEARATRRYLAWARKSEPKLRRAITLGMRHGLTGRFGPPPPDLMP
ncbi:MAG TPA: glycosyltransferase family 2 protein [Actinomycetota bacterium]